MADTLSLAAEAAAAPMSLQAALDAGLNSLSNTQKVTFTTYNKSTMPIDGFVFWVASATSAQYTGSVHHIIKRRQDHDQTIAENKIIFTSESEITQFNLIDPQTLLVGSWEVDGVQLQMVFNDQAALYVRANLYHYSGDAVYPALAAQLIENIGDLPVGPIVSNSLPIWLSQNGIAPVYPSYLVPDNTEPPYIAVHIPPEETETLGQFPIFTWPGTPQGGGADPINLLPITQLMRDKVELTLYGFTNAMAFQYLCGLEDYSLLTDDFGFCNSPAIRDDKRIQSEITAIAMKKTITILASYYQGAADMIARRLILSSTVSLSLT